MVSSVAITGEINRSAAKQERFEDYVLLYDFLYDHRVVLDFAVFKVMGEEIGAASKPFFEKWNDVTDDGTTDISEADVFLSGSIKWDGCSNWNFDGQANCMLHFCGVKDASSIGRLMERMYDIASVEIEGFDRDLADMPPQIISRTLSSERLR